MNRIAPSATCGAMGLPNLPTPTKPTVILAMADSRSRPTEGTVRSSRRPNPVGPYLGPPQASVVDSYLGPPQASAVDSFLVPP